jgi:tetratricopeptide (TPR) repeat protein
LENTNLRNGNFDRAVALFADIANLYPFHIFAWYGLARAYKGKGDLQQAGAAMARIAMLIQMDRRSREMYEKFGYLVNDWPPIAPPSA